MTTIECLKQERVELDHLERVRYFPRQLVTAGDLTQDQHYQRGKRRLHNRLLHGWGIVCGLEVKTSVSGAPLKVTIGPGYALSPQGDEIYVPTEIQFDLEQCIKSQSAPCSSPRGPSVLGAVDPAKDFYLAIKYAECLSHPVRVTPVGCGCDDTACEYSRIRDDFKVACLDKLPDSYDDKYKVPGEFCSVITTTKVVAFPECPNDPWIVLAKVYEDGEVLPAPSLDCRRVLLSTAVMQEHLSEQCRD